MTAKRIKAFVATDGSVGATSLHSLLATEPNLEIVGMIDTDSARRERPLAPDASALVVVCGDHGQVGALRLIGEAVADRPDRPVVVLASGSPNGFLREALQAGADDLVTLNGNGRSGTDVFMAVEKALTRRQWSTDQASHESQLVCVLGPKGGTGKTLTSANLALALQEKGHATVAVDLDLQFGDLGLALGLPPEKTLFDLATSGGSLDAEKIAAFTVRHDSGLQTLLAPVRPDQAAAIKVDFLRELYASLLHTYDFVVVDTPPGFTPEVITSIDNATDICLLGMLDAPSLKNAKLGLETLQLMGYPGDRIRVVLNRADTSVGISHSDVAELLGREPDVLVPSHRDVVRAVNAGRPLVIDKPRSEAARAFRSLAEMVIAQGESETETATVTRRMFRAGRRG